MNSPSYIHDDPVPDTSQRGKSGYSFVHIAGLTAVVAVLALVMLMS
ncbi:MAG: hypothetical protein QM755_04390 [Luteolibacter sp.]